MSCKKCLLLAAIVELFIGTTIGCIQINTTCEELRKDDGFRYPHKCPTGSKVEVDENREKIAIVTLGSDLSAHEYLRPDMKMDDTSFVRKDCSDLSIKCTVNEGGWARDICQTYEITGCIQINTTCEELRKDNGYRYPHKCPTGSKVEVDENGEKIAIVTLGSDLSTHEYLRPDIKMDNTSFVRKHCSDLRIKCTINDEGRVRATCRTYENAESKETDDSRGKIIGGIFVLLIIAIIAIIAIIVMFHQSILDALQARKKIACCPSNRKNSQGISQNGNHSREGASGYELDNDLNTVAEMSATQPVKGSCDDNKRNIALEGVQGPSSHPQTGVTQKDHVSIVDETQAKDGGTSVSDDVPDEVPYSRDMHRTQRDDPGGKAAGCVRMGKMQNGLTRCESGPEDDGKNESEPLLPVEGGTNQHSDMTGEGIAPVIGSCSDPDLDNMDSVALDTDVESAHFVKNYELNILDNNNTINNNTL